MPKKHLEEKIKELALTIDEVEDEKLEIENKLKKALADYINLEQGIDRRVQSRLEQVKVDLGRSIIEIMDDFFYALEASKKLKLDESTKAWMQGISSTIGKMKNVLGTLNIEMMNVQKGDPFDFSKHEALGTVEEKGLKEDTIQEVVQPGYMMGENIVRPARVIVCKKIK